MEYETAKMCSDPNMLPTCNESRDLVLYYEIASKSINREKSATQVCSAHVS